MGDVVLVYVVEADQGLPDENSCIIFFKSAAPLYFPKEIAALADTCDNVVVTLIFEQLKTPKLRR